MRGSRSKGLPPPTSRLGLVFFLRRSSRQCRQRAGAGLWVWISWPSLGRILGFQPSLQQHPRHRRRPHARACTVRPVCVHAYAGVHLQRSQPHSQHSQPCRQRAGAVLVAWISDEPVEVDEHCAPAAPICVRMLARTSSMPPLTVFELPLAHPGPCPCTTITTAGTLARSPAHALLFTPRTHACSSARRDKLGAWCSLTCAHALDNVARA